MQISHRPRLNMLETSSSILISFLHNFIIFPPSHPPPHFFIHFSPNKYIDLISTYMDPTSTLFFNTASWIVKLYISTSTFPLFSHHHHQISIVSPPPPPPRPPPPPPPSHFYCFSNTTAFLLFSLLLLLSCYKGYLSLTFLAWLWPFRPDFGLSGRKTIGGVKTIDMWGWWWCGGGGKTADSR